MFCLPCFAFFHPPMHHFLSSILSRSQTRFLLLLKSSFLCPSYFCHFHPEFGFGHMLELVTLQTWSLSKAPKHARPNSSFTSSSKHFRYSKEIPSSIPKSWSWSRFSLFQTMLGAMVRRWNGCGTAHNLRRPCSSPVSIRVGHFDASTSSPTR